MTEYTTHGMVPDATRSDARMAFLMVELLRGSARMSLQPLREIQHTDGRDTPDLRSWRVLSNDGTPLGIVAEVIVDVDDARPVYLQVLPDPHPEGTPPECWVRVPCRHVAIDEEAREIVLSDAALLGLGTATIGRLVE